MRPAHWSDNPLALSLVSIIVSFAFLCAVVLPFTAGKPISAYLAGCAIAAVIIGIPLGRHAARTRAEQMARLHAHTGGALVAAGDRELTRGLYALPRKGRYASDYELDLVDGTRFVLHRRAGLISTQQEYRIERDAAERWRVFWVLLGENEIAHVRFARLAGRWELTTSDGMYVITGRGVRTFDLLRDDVVLVTFTGRWGPTFSFDVLEPTPAWLVLAAVHCMLLTTPR